MWLGPVSEECLPVFRKNIRPLACIELESFRTIFCLWSLIQLVKPKTCIFSSAFLLYRKSSPGAP